MAERITNHLKWMDDYLCNMEGKSVDELSKTMKKHMTEIYFFMHERMIHLIVTVLFALGSFMTVFTYLLTENIGLVALGYLLENGVQKMYRQYDALLEQIERRKEEG